MTEIVPCVTVETPEEYKDYVQKIHPFAKRVHVDISDGEFAPTFLLGESRLWWPQEWTIDVHAMVARPSEHFEALIALKPNMIIFHVEVKENLLPMLQYLQKIGIKAGIALQRPTAPSTVSQLIEVADHVMIFSGDLGHYGGVASLMQLEKVRLIRAIKQSVEIGWDGGVTVENAYGLSQGGVDVLNVGSTIAKASDPAAAYAALTNEIGKKGVL